MTEWDNWWAVWHWGAHWFMNGWFRMAFLLLQKTFVISPRLWGQLRRGIKYALWNRSLSMFAEARHANEINNTTKKSDREDYVENISANQIARGYWVKQISPHNPFTANGYLGNAKSHVTHSLHNSWSSWTCVRRFECVCVCVCVCSVTCLDA